MVASSGGQDGHDDTCYNPRHCADCFRWRLVRQGSLVLGLEASRPADRAVRKIELILNLKIAKTLGLQIPDKPLALADEVIE